MKMAKSFQCKVLNTALNKISNKLDIITLYWIINKMTKTSYKPFNCNFKKLKENYKHL